MFNQKKFATISAQSTDTPRIYSYSSIDSFSLVTALNYFINKKFQLRKGDLIYCQLSDGNFMLEVSADQSTATQFISTPTDNLTAGFFDYNDLATVATPIIVTPASGHVLLTNDGEGANTNKNFAPVGMTDIWLSGSNTFDWSQLKMGDMIDIRIDLELITTSVNTEIHVDLHLGTGIDAYTINFLSGLNFKETGTHFLGRFNGLYLGNANTIDNGGQFKIRADKNCSVTVVGWYVKVLVRG